MFYSKISKYELRQECLFTEDGTPSFSERIFIYTTVRDFENFSDEEVPSTIIIVKGLDTQYLRLMVGNDQCIGDVYPIEINDKLEYVFDVFTTEDDFDRILDTLKSTKDDKVNQMLIWVNLHEYVDFKHRGILPVTYISLSLDENDSPAILIGVTP